VKSLLALAGAALAAGTAAAAVAAPLSAPPVGPLPKSPVVSVSGARGTTIAVSLPKQRASSGLVWRVARKFDSHVVQQAGEGEIGAYVVLIFRTVGRGKTTLSFGLTKGETAKAFKAARYAVTVR
jgi:hypothetical protein